MWGRRSGTRASLESMAAKTRLFLTVFVTCLVLDQLTKVWVVSEFYYAERWVLIPELLDFTYVRNPGGAFSFLADAPALARKSFFLGTTIVAIGLLLLFFRRLPENALFSSLALGAILGGAVGNLIDRIAYGAVVDFIDVHLWGGYIWPTFNLADSFIVVGVAILMIETFFGDEEFMEPDKK